ncbi:MAG: site-specific integrase [Planctomycetota bacterium]
MPERVLSNGRKAAKPVRPEKPYPDYPLTPHASGKWCKKVRGKLHYFGTWDDPNGALSEWLAAEPHIRATGEKESDNTESDIRYLCNSFLDSKEQQRDGGDLSPRAYSDYKKACDRIVDHFGKSRLLSTIDAPDFQRLRACFPKTWGSTTINNNIANISAVFNYAYEIGAVDRPVRKGPNFKRMSKKRQRLERAKKPPKTFTATELHQLIDAADFQMKAMILLGINAGYGNADCGRLLIPMIDFERSWLEGLREKTAIERAAWLWPETVDALKFAIENKHAHAPPSLAENVFVTLRRQSWFKENGKANPISASFRKLCQKVGVHAEGKGFYALRHVFETEAGNSKDQIAVNYVMGHTDDTMAAVYREGIDPKRVIAVCSHVREWWLAGKPLE